MSLPNIAPSARSITDGFFYIAQKEWRLGGTTRNPIGTTLQQLRLTVEFENIDDAIAAQFVDAYNAAHGGLFPVTLPAGFTAGLSLEMQGLLADAGQWFITNPTAVRSVQPGVSTVSVELIREINESIPSRTRPSDGDLFDFDFGSGYRARFYRTGQPRERDSSDRYLVRFYENGYESQEYAPSDVYLVAEYETTT